MRLFNPDGSVGIWRLGCCMFFVNVLLIIFLYEPMLGWIQNGFLRYLVGAVIGVVFNWGFFWLVSKAGFFK